MLQVLGGVPDSDGDVSRHRDLKEAQTYGGLKLLNESSAIDLEARAAGEIAGRSPPGPSRALRGPACCLRRVLERGERNGAGKELYKENKSLKGALERELKTDLKQA